MNDSRRRAWRSAQGVFVALTAVTPIMLYLITIDIIKERAEKIREKAIELYVKRIMVAGRRPFGIIYI